MRSSLKRQNRDHDDDNDGHTEDSKANQFFLDIDEGGKTRKQENINQKGAKDRGSTIG